MSESFLRAWYQASRWSSAEVPPFTVIVMPPNSWRANVTTLSKWSSCSNFFSIRFSTSSCTCCAVAPGQTTIAVIEGTEKFGSSSWPRRVKLQRARHRDDQEEEEDDGAVVRAPTR